MRHFALSAAIFIFAGQSATAETLKLSETDLQSARCALIAAMLPGDEKATEAQRTARTAGTVYFFGKLRGRMPDARFDDIFSRTLILDVADNFEKYRKACGEELMQVGPEMSALGKRITAMADDQETANSVK